MDRVTIAREKYRPDYIKLMFIAEAPPCSDDRFFYFEDVTKGDSLFLHIIRAVFPDLENWETKQIRAKKEELLYRFKDAGYFLEDSVSVSIPKGTTTKQKMNIITENQQDLIKRIEAYKKKTKFVLLSATVFKVNYLLLKQAGFNILNEIAIPFPGSGQQGKFKKLIADIDLN
jgi:hypothetical protein